MHYKIIYLLYSFVTCICDRMVKNAQVHCVETNRNGNLPKKFPTVTLHLETVRTCAAAQQFRGSNLQERILAMISSKLMFPLLEE